MKDNYDSIFSPERRKARRYDSPYRSRPVSDHVYAEGELSAEERRGVWAEISNALKEFNPAPSIYNTYFGELHGHSCLSDGQPDPDAYYKQIRDCAKLDFAALTDHNHGGVGSDTLYGRKESILRDAAIRYNDPGRFSTFLAYEVDAYPYYNNMVVYHSDPTGDILRPSVNGDITAQELKALLSMPDRLVIPHDTYDLESGADFDWMDPELFTPLIEIYSRGDSAEYFDNPQNQFGMCRGGCWQDALRRGAKMGCIAASDDHRMCNGMPITDRKGNIQQPGITGVLCEENTPESIFRALKARRCYGFTGGRMWIDFRINGHYMGESFTSSDDRQIYFSVHADAPVSRITLVKNNQDYMYTPKTERMIFDYGHDSDCDYYYLRVQLSDGRVGWTSPIWISRA